MTPEYNAFNERLKKQYEDALIHGSHKQIKTADAVWKSINLFEEFTGKKDFTSFNTQQAKDFKRWLDKQTNARGEPLSISTVRSTLAHIREFFKWLATHPKCIRKVDGQAVVYLRMSNNDERAGRATREQDIPTLEQVRKALEAMPTETAMERRNRAMIAFTALTGVRDAALISLKLGDVDLAKREIWQNPRHVRTKNRKAITTIFMAFDSLWEEIVMDWITYATTILNFGPNDPLFPKEGLISSSEKMKFESAGLVKDHWANTTPAREIFKNGFACAGLPYFRPHSFRNMLVNWAMENCSQIEVKAISQNLGHEEVMTTYNAYGNLNIQTQRKAIMGIGSGVTNLNNIPSHQLIHELQKRTNK